MRWLKIKLTIKTVFVFLFVSIFAFISFAWYTNEFHYPNYLLGHTKGSLSSYFLGGTGTDVDPFIIAEAEHMYNLARLNNLGYFDTQTYYFKVADENGDSTIIDFTDPDVLPVHQVLQPVGDSTYPFKGVFYGNYSVLQNLTIDGNGKQDIGVFGYVYNYAEIYELFIEEPTIISNPSTLDDNTSFHEHNNNLLNRATGYIAGHLGMGAIVDNVFVYSSTIESLSNNDTNRSQYGLLGYNEAEAGVIPGSPRNSYAFTMDAVSAYNAITYAQNNYSSYYINGGSSLVLGNVLAYGSLNSGYSLSTLRISPIPNDPDPVLLYDQLVADGYVIGAAGSEYSKENIDVVGDISFGTTNYQIYQNLGSFTTPAVGSTFEATNHPNAIFLYVKPTNDLSDLGNVTGTYGGGGNFSYLSGFDASGNYIPNRAYGNKNSPGVTNFGASGVTQTMIANYAWTSVIEVTDPITEEVHLEVVDETVIPDYYVFLLAVTNGQITINSIVFEYLPQAIQEEDFQTVGNMDYIDASMILSIHNYVDTEIDPYTAIQTNIIDNHYYSLVYFNYNILAGQYLETYINRLPNNTGYDLYIDYSITAGDFFYFDIINVKNNTINIYINDTYVNSYSNVIIAIEFVDGSYTITPT